MLLGESKNTARQKESKNTLLAQCLSTNKERIPQNLGYSVVSWFMPSCILVMQDKIIVCIWAPRFVSRVDSYMAVSSSAQSGNPFLLMRRNINFGDSVEGMKYCQLQQWPSSSAGYSLCIRCCWHKTLYRLQRAASHGECSRTSPNIDFVVVIVDRVFFRNKS